MVRTSFAIVGAALLAACTATPGSDDAPDASPGADDGAVAALEPFTVVDDATFKERQEVTQGEGWQLLRSQPRTFQRIGVGFGVDDPAVERVWQTYRMDGDPPPIAELEEELVLVGVPAECEFVLRDVVFEDLVQDEVGADIRPVRLVAEIPEDCDDPDETGRFLAFAIDAEVLDADRVDVIVGNVPAGRDTRF